jgi:hypothetical protein
MRSLLPEVRPRYPSHYTDYQANKLPSELKKKYFPEKKFPQKFLQNQETSPSYIR